MWRTVEKIQQWIDENSDQRTKNWLFVESAVPTLIICAVFNITLVILSKYMRNRKGLNVRNYFLIFNIFHFSSSFAFLAVTVDWKFLTEFNFR